MEANFFRALLCELEQAVLMRRIEKIFLPTDNTWTLQLDSRGAFRFVIYQPAKTAGLFFTTNQKPINPMQAPARAMWYRKRLTGRRILAQHTDWQNLRCAWQLSPSKESRHGRYLIFSLREDISLTDDLEETYFSEAKWPNLEQILSPESELWHEYPCLSPRLRHILQKSPFEQAKKLYQNISQGKNSGFFLAPSKGASPLPWQSSDTDKHFDSALEAATIHGEQTLFPLLEHEALCPERARLKRERKKIRRALARLEQEQNVLKERHALGLNAEALQAELYRFKGQEKLSFVQAQHPQHGNLDIELNPALSLLENMEYFFKLAAKAKRGEIHLAKRRNELGKEMARLEAQSQCFPQEQHTQQVAPQKIPRRYQGLAVDLFTSSDGMIIVRGKNKKANHQILSQIASPFDWWLHVAHGSSSHVIIKRDFPKQEVPEQTLREAAILCALKSHYHNTDKAEIVFALVKNIRKVKGWDHGHVAVDQVLGSIRVPIDHELEEKLRANTKKHE